MRTTKTFALITLASASLSLTAQTYSDGPTMGWSSWNTYASKINAALIERQADAMVSKGLKDAGYTYINIDDGFQAGRDASTGQLLVNTTRFPQGLKPVADYIHSKGLKAGIYSDAGHNTCASYYNGEKQEEGTGLYEHDQQDCDYFFKELGFDFIKVDYCGGDGPQNSEGLTLDEKTRYTAIGKAILATGRNDVRYNVCRWNYPGTWVSDVSTSWRTTVDINASWNSVKNILLENLYMSAYSSRGHYNDMDMLEVGRGLSAEEDKTHFGMWCMLNSPLLIGCDMSTISSEALSLLTNKELIALDQDSLADQAHVVKYTNGCYILVRDIEHRHGTVRAFAVFNPQDAARTISVSFANLDLTGNVSVRDLFAKSDLGKYETTFSVSVPAHGTRIYRIEGEGRTEQKRYEAEAAYISDYQEIYNNESLKTGNYSQASNCSGGYKAGWLGYSSQNDLQFRNVYSENGGDYELAIAYISGENRNISINVNGISAGTLTVNSGNWNNVKTASVKIHLNEGDNIIRLYNAASWMPDIDYIELANLATGIAKTKTGQKNDGRIYNINGTQVAASEAVHGVYIANGKKTLQK